MRKLYGKQHYNKFRFRLLIGFRNLLIKKCSNYSFLSCCILLLLQLNCSEENPVDNKNPCPPIQVISTSPYDSPVWHPSGEFIGFNYTPLARIDYPYGEDCIGIEYFDWDSSGFWIINSDGTNMHRVFPYKLHDPAWSPDGNWIAFVMFSGDKSNIYKMRFDGTSFDSLTLTQLTFEGRNFFPAWSPDGEWIAYDSNVNNEGLVYVIWKMHKDGANKINISEPWIGGSRTPNWHPLGERIVYQDHVVGVDASEIFSMDSSGRNPFRLTYNSNSDRNPSYSPDGEKVAFWSDGYIWLMDKYGENPQQLTYEVADATFGLPFSWSPNGNKIIYTKHHPNKWLYDNGVLWIVDINTRGHYQFTFNLVDTLLRR